MKLKENLITVLIKQPGKEPEVDPFFENTLAAFQKAVDGYIESVRLFEDLAIICDEEGRLKGRPHNANILGVDFVGTVIAVGVDGDSFCSIKPADIEFVKKLIGGVNCDIRQR